MVAGLRGLVSPFRRILIAKEHSAPAAFSLQASFLRRAGVRAERNCSHRSLGSCPGSVVSVDMHVLRMRVVRMWQKEFDNAANTARTSKIY